MDAIVEAWEAQLKYSCVKRITKAEINSVGPVFSQFDPTMTTQSVKGNFSLAIRCDPPESLAVETGKRQHLSKSYQGATNDTSCASGVHARTDSSLSCGKLAAKRCYAASPIGCCNALYYVLVLCHKVARALVICRYMWPVKLQGSAGMDYGFCMSVYFRSRHISGINASEHGIAFVLHGPCHILSMIGSYKSEKGLTASTGQTSTAGSDVKTHPLANTEAAASLANAATVKEKLRNKMLHDAAAYGTLRMPAVLLCFSNHLPFPCVPPPCSTATNHAASSILHLLL